MRKKHRQALGGLIPGDMRVWFKPTEPAAEELVLLIRRRDGGDSFWEVLGSDGVLHTVQWIYLDELEVYENGS